MSWRRIRAVLDKELHELRRNKMIIVSMAVVPLVLVAVVVVINFVLGNTPPSGQRLHGFTAPTALVGLKRFSAFTVLLNDQFMFYLLFIPMLLPTMVAAHSVIGEKQARTLEPLLATPLRTWELLVAKTIAAAGPAILIGWLSYAIAVGGVYVVSSWEVARFLLRPLWSVGQLALTPLLALLSTLIAVCVSSRVSDVRVAQGVAGVGVLPLMAAAMTVIIGQTYLDVTFLVVCIGALLLIDLGLLRLAVTLFQRETILTRWK
jgi:ABC-2 type transport system permease protein